jgi:hypothetical protein
MASPPNFDLKEIFMDEQALESSVSVGGGMSAVGIIIMLAIMVFFIATMWKLFTKAGKPGWASLVPIYNLVVYLEIVGRPVWWIVLMILPIVSFIVLIVMTVDLAKSFGKGGGFAVGLIFLGFIFYPILAFGSAQYVGPAAKTAG